MRFIVEVAKGSLLKRSPAGAIEFISPMPCPFNYGSQPDAVGEDGDPPDVVILGKRRPRGSQGQLPLRARVRFIDGGLPDDKWVCSARPLRRRDRLLVRAFFRVYVLPKKLRDRLRGHPLSQYGGLEVFPPPAR